MRPGSGGLSPQKVIEYPQPLHLFNKKQGGCSLLKECGCRQGYKVILPEKIKGFEGSGCTLPKEEEESAIGHFEGAYRERLRYIEKWSVRTIHCNVFSDRG